MRLIDTLTGQFVEVPDHHTLPYAILSHTWDANGEQTYQDVLRLQKSWLPTCGARSIVYWMLCHLWRILILLLTRMLSCLHLAVKGGHLNNSSLLRLPETWQSSLAKRLFVWKETFEEVARNARSDLSYLHGTLVSKKIRDSCAVALSDGYRYIWIDSCCIDKASSSELSEAINSMFVWYSYACVCYTFMADVPDGDDPYLPDSAFRRSRWFTRGWTLQELIAPRVVVFYSKGWQVVGTKFTLALVLTQLTGIKPSILSFSRELSSVSVAVRMSWASRRQTTRVEDQAYSLLGIFDINMPTLYGEGSRAFRRLQEEILRTIPDQTLFAWGRRVSWGNEMPDVSMKQRSRMLQSARLEYDHESIYAATPADFAEAGDLRPIPQQLFIRRLGIPPFTNPEYVTTPYGIRTQLPCVSLNAFPDILRSIWLSHAETQAKEWYLVLLAAESVTRGGGHVVARICYSGPPYVHSELTTLKTGYIYSLSIPTMQPAWPHSMYTLSTVSTRALGLVREHIENTTVLLSTVHSRRSPTDDEDEEDVMNVPPVLVPGWVHAVLRLSECRLECTIEPEDKAQMLTLSDHSGNCLATIKYPPRSGDSLFIDIYDHASPAHGFAILEWFNTRHSSRGWVHKAALSTGQKQMVHITLVRTASSSNPFQRIVGIELLDGNAASLRLSSTTPAREPDMRDRDGGPPLQDTLVEWWNGSFPICVDDDDELRGEERMKSPGVLTVPILFEGVAVTRGPPAEDVRQRVANIPNTTAGLRVSIPPQF